MLYRGAKPGALYRGSYKPGKLYKGTQLIAGYADAAKDAPATWEGTYDDVMGVTATTVTLPVLRAIPGTDIRDTLAYIGGGQWQVTRRVGVIDSYAGESVGNTWASSTGQLTTGGLVRTGDAHYGDVDAGGASQLPRPHGAGRLRRLSA